jgi:hypothetical protein
MALDRMVWLLIGSWSAPRSDPFFEWLVAAFSKTPDGFQPKELNPFTVQ